MGREYNMLSELRKSRRSLQMKTMEIRLSEEMHQLEKIVKEATKRLDTAPKGKLRIAMRNI